MQGNVVSVQQGNFPVWKTVKRGVVPKTVEELVGVINDRPQMMVSDWAKCILRGLDLTSSVESVDEIGVVRLSPLDLGFKGRVTYEGVCDRAEELGLGFCPNLTAPWLRLEYFDQPRGEKLVVPLMRPVICDRNFSVFELQHDPCNDQLCLYGLNTSLRDFHYREEHNFLFLVGN